MLKHLHLLFAAIVAITFIGRVFAAQYKPELLAHKWMKIAPHVIASLLLLTGIGLVFQGGWLASGNYGWIIVKLFLMVVFIGLGMMAIKQEGEKRWYAFGGALFCLAYIIKLAVTKQVFFLF